MLLFDPLFFFGGGIFAFFVVFFQRLLLPHHLKRTKQKCHESFSTSDPPKAWEEMQEEGLEANAVGESQSRGAGAPGNLVQRVWTRPGDLWLYVGCLCEMWSPRKGTWHQLIVGFRDCWIVGLWDSFLLSQVFVICFLVP